MKRTYTPLDIHKLEKKYAPLQGKEEKAGFDSIFNTVLILLATLTVLVISILLFLLIQKQMNSRSYHKASVLVMKLSPSL